MAGRKKKDEKIDTAKVLKRETRKIKQATGQPVKAGRPKKQGYTKEKADEVLEHISNGMTVTQACARSGIKRLDFLRWVEVVPELKAEYSVALKRLAGALVDGVLIETQGIENESQSRVVLNKSKIVQWAAGSLDNEMWGNRRSYEIGGQISMTHTHSLTQEQRERIAASWLMAKGISLPKGKAEVVIEANPVYKEINGEVKLLEVEEVAKIRGVPESAEIREKEEEFRKLAEGATNPEERRNEKNDKVSKSHQERRKNKVLGHLKTIDSLVLDDISSVKSEIESVK